MACVISSFAGFEPDVDPLVLAKQRAPRKVFRFLDEVSAPPFVVGVSLLERAAVVAPDKIAVYTVSRWEAPVLRPTIAGDDGSEHQLARYYLDSSNPTDWLRSMPNNALCQIAIVTGFQGPNIHFVGDGTAVAQTFSIADFVLERGQAEVAAVVGFDVDGSTGRCNAAGVLLRASGEDGDALPDDAWMDAHPDAFTAMREVTRFLGSQADADQLSIGDTPSVVR